MNYQQALAQIKAEKQVPHYLEIRFNYSTKLILPYKDGMAVLEGLKYAEQREDYPNDHYIRALTSSQLQVTTLSAQEYQRQKMATLLQISLDDLLALEKEHATTS